ncbi:CBS domain-containing protein [Acidisoma sp. 7E03]
MRVQDIMTRDVATVRPDATIEAVIAVMLARHASGVPVVAADGALAGIITEGDLLRRVETSTEEPARRSLFDLLFGSGRQALDYVRSHSRRVSDLMTERVVTITEEASLVEVVRLMESKHIRRVPVVQGDRLVGIVSRADLIRALGRRLAEIASGDPAASDDALADAARRALERAGLFDNASVAVAVEDGMALLQGVIHDERLRPALRVAVETVPGIRAVQDEVVFVEPVTGSIYSA